tara:strand:- start:3559 stop:4143 length:585 start_codon:yes stop_codon:yes gene_type:complete
LIAVTKTQPAEKINEAIQNGIKIIGENKIQEAEEKFEKLDQKIEKHFIGHLQRNKTKKAVRLFDVIQTVDSQKIIKNINKEAKKIEKKQKIMLQVNVGRDERKYGFLLEELNVVELKDYKNIEIIGIMTIPPQNKTDQELREIFKSTKRIQEEIKKTIKTCKETSMGMSGDYMLAIKEGATYIRIGTNLFGKRK